MSNIKYHVIAVNSYDLYYPSKYTEVITEDKGFATWLVRFLSSKEESPFITYEIEEEHPFE